MNTLGRRSDGQLGYGGQILWTMGRTALAAGAPPEVDARVAARDDAALEDLLRAQTTGAASRRRGGGADEYGMFDVGSPGGPIEMAEAWMALLSKYHGALLERIRLAAQFLQRSQSGEGNIDLLSTNFNSPPGTGFVVHNMATAAAIAKMYGEQLFRVLLSTLPPNGILPTRPGYFPAIYAALRIQS